MQKQFKPKKLVFGLVDEIDKYNELFAYIQPSLHKDSQPSFLENLLHSQKNKKLNKILKNPCINSKGRTKDASEFQPDSFFCSDKETLEKTNCYKYISLAEQLSEKEAFDFFPKYLLPCVDEGFIAGCSVSGEDQDLLLALNQDLSVINHFKLPQNYEDLTFDPCFQAYYAVKLESSNKNAGLRIDIFNHKFELLNSSLLSLDKPAPQKCFQDKQSPPVQVIAYSKKLFILLPALACIAIISSSNLKLEKLAVNSKLRYATSAAIVQDYLYITLWSLHAILAFSLDLSSLKIKKEVKPFFPVRIHYDPVLKRIYLLQLCFGFAFGYLYKYDLSFNCLGSCIYLFSSGRPPPICKRQNHELLFGHENSLLIHKETRQNSDKNLKEH